MVLEGVGTTAKSLEIVRSSQEHTREDMDYEIRIICFKSRKIIL